MAPLIYVSVDVSADPELPPDRLSSLSNLAARAVCAVLLLEGYNLAEGEPPANVACTEVSVLYTSDALIAGLNARYRSVEGPTDVLSFALNEGGDQYGGEGENEDECDAGGRDAWDGDVPNMLGDIVISLETAERQAAAAGKTAVLEITLLLIHGTLHLLGYDHDTPEKEAVMWKRQDEALRAMPGA